MCELLHIIYLLFLLRPCVTDSEIDYLAQIDKIPKNYYELNFVEKDNFDDIKYLKNTPCKYLKDKECTIYENRPFDCKSYPHTHKKNFTSRSLSMIENYEICPIVFNVYERLKDELNYRYNYWSFASKGNSIRNS